MIRVVFGLPAYGGKSAMWQARMWFSLGVACADNREQFTVRGFPLKDRCGVDVARNELVVEALQAASDEDAAHPFGQDAAWLLMVDADTWHEGDLDGGADILRMIKTAEQMKNVAVIAAPVPVRSPGVPKHMVYKYGDEDWPGTGRKRLRPMAREEWDDRVVECDAIATALFAINLRAVLACPPPWFDYRYLQEGTLLSLGEDVYCCEKLRDRGWRTMVDGRFIAKHVSHGEVY